MRWFKLKRPRLQFSLRMLLLLVTIFCVIVGGPLRRARIQQLAVEALKENGRGFFFGNEIGYDFQLQPSTRVTSEYGQRLKSPEEYWYFDTQAVPPGPAWLHRWIGRDYWGTVVQYRQRDQVTDQEMQNVGQLAGLVRLIIHAQSISDSQFSHVSHLTNLQYLELSPSRWYSGRLQLDHLSGLNAFHTVRLGGMGFTGLQHLAALPSLRELSLQGTIVGSELQHLARAPALRVLTLGELDEEGIAQLRSLTQLEALDLSGVRLSPLLGESYDLKDHHLEPVGHLRQLRRLWLRGTFITDAGLRHLRGLTELEELDLSGTRVTAAGLEFLRGMKQLRRLSLDGTKITDPGLENLRGMVAMEELNLGGTRIGNAGLAYLREMKRLRVLHLDETCVGDAGLAHLGALTELVRLYLNKTKIGDSGIEQLKALPKLEYMQLQETRIGDGAVPILMSMPALKKATFSQNQFSAEGHKKLWNGQQSLDDSVNVGSS